ncbi:hypothetical protein M8818_000060 [Zalaria obscura]|uniref:Uncharacterized protein n=1 Tax=Zalaria obscura TaxID=2024903 RepID=A0ACC3SRV4_9PEZI
MQRPRISKQGRKLQLSYELTHRLHASKLYPVTAPNGSDIIITGYDNGIKVAWRGGKSIANQGNGKDTPLTNGANHDVIPLDDDEGLGAYTNDPESDDEPMYESDEEEDGDPEQSYPAIIQQLDLPMGHHVTDVAVPDLPPDSKLMSTMSVPSLFEDFIVVAVACSDCTAKVIMLPLLPPSEGSRRKKNLGVRVCSLNGISDAREVVRTISLSWTSSQPSADEDMDIDHDKAVDLLVALCTSEQSGRLLVYRVPAARDGRRSNFLKSNVEPVQSLFLPCNPVKIAFNAAHHPSKRHSQLLIADMQGCLRIYDPLAIKSQRGRSLGAWHMTFTSSFRMPKNTSSNAPGLAQRKKILDSRWVFGGKAIIALLDDGEWGVWDVEGITPKSQTKSSGTSPAGFSIHGFLNDGASADTSDSRVKSSSRLAPMTPNTRRVRQENLFEGPKSAPGTAPRGGISVASTSTPHGTADDSIVLWYNNDAYAIPSLTTFWQRSINSSGRDTGSLYSPGLSRLEGLDLFGEIINHVDQFSSRASSTGLGSIAQRDVLITGEHRMIVLANTRPQVPSKALFAAREPESPTIRRDQQLLSRGELDIGGMDRMLDGMMGVETTGALQLGKAKRVGFAAH